MFFVCIPRTALKSTVILLPLLGLTWIIGPFSLLMNTDVLSWIFAILNSLQVRNSNCCCQIFTILHFEHFLQINHNFSVFMYVFSHAITKCAKKPNFTV